MNPRIERVRAIPLNLPVDVSVAGAAKRTALSCVIVRVDTD